MTVSAPLLDVRGLAVGREGNEVAHIEDLELGPGEPALLLGPSGSGKSTTLFTLAGLLRPIRGSVRIAGEAVTSTAPIRRRIGLVFQDVHLLPGLSVIDNVLLSAFAQGRAQDRRAALDALQALGLGALAGRRAETLSRGEAQRVAIARTIVMEPALILADEPTASLDDGQAERVADLLQLAAVQTGAALLIATHDQRLGRRFPLQIALKPAAVTA